MYSTLKFSDTWQMLSLAVTWIKNSCYSLKHGYEDIQKVVLWPISSKITASHSPQHAQSMFMHIHVGSSAKTICNEHRSHNTAEPKICASLMAESFCTFRKIYCLTIAVHKVENKRYFSKTAQSLAPSGAINHISMYFPVDDNTDYFMPHPAGRHLFTLPLLFLSTLLTGYTCFLFIHFPLQENINMVWSLTI